MRRIDKNCILSTEYKKWADNLEREGKSFPNSKKYRRDVIMNLLLCQKGVCAYTEIDLGCDPEHLKKTNWKKGRYNEKIDVDNFGSMDHFDSNYTKEKGKFWKWENLFVVYSDINTWKKDKPVDDILKPDLPGYDPFTLLTYNIRTHHFWPHPAITDKDKRERIKKMLKVLQLNRGAVRNKRKKFLKRAETHIRRFESPFEPECFFTAYEMWKTKMETK